MRKLIDHAAMVGRTFGQLLVLEIVTPAAGRRKARIRCACGIESTMNLQHIASGATQSCGCQTKKRITERLLKDMTGRRVGRLTVLRLDGRTSVGQARWLCKCECGSETHVAGAHLRRGETKSCGCLQPEMMRRAMTTHGHTKGHKVSTYYGTYNRMIARCHKRGSKDYYWYGARGIAVCEGWRKSFEAFAADMGPKPNETQRWSIDRIDNERGYDCGKCQDCARRGASANCRWATDKEQARNTRRNVYVEVLGERMTFSDAIRKHAAGKPPMTFWARLYRGQTPEEALGISRRTA